MSDQTLVSIIIPTYNHAHFIGETPDSVLSQVFQNWECIIVDDRSLYNTENVEGDFVKEDSHFKYYHRPEEYAKGANSCRYVGFLESNEIYVN